MIENLILKKEQSLIQWDCNQLQRQSSVFNIDQVMLDERRNIIIILSDMQKFPQRLDVLDEDGLNIFSCSPPQGASFYYLTKASTSEILIVCAFDEKHEGWHDWHYSFDERIKKLLQKSPAY
ncbi:hypothetical protein [Erwinia oleae]|uniref:hypothetical protein n=1 Tax=Erwinia oleae TaxID=796334 RepID=UPI0009078D19|nr:hypothetical protein [Erwinia oleae]